MCFILLNFQCFKDEISKEACSRATRIARLLMHVSLDYLKVANEEHTSGEVN